MRCIYLDMDGVIVDFVGAALSLYKVPRESRKYVKGWDGIPGVVSEHHGVELEDSQMWEDIAEAGSAFWRDIEWMPWGRELYEMCCSTAPTVLMTTPTGAPSAAGKMQWVEDHIGPTGGKDKIRLSMTNCKHHFARDTSVLIDDNTINCKMFQEYGGHAMLFPAPWNAHGIVPSHSFALNYVKEFLEEWK